jgi:hypothetical protein
MSILAQSEYDFPKKIEEKELETFLEDKNTPELEDLDRVAPETEVQVNEELSYDSVDDKDDEELTPEQRVLKNDRKKKREDQRKLKEVEKDLHWLPQPSFNVIYIFKLNVVSKAARAWFGVPAGIQIVFYLIILILTAVNPSPTWYNLFNIIITFVFFGPGLVGCIFGVIGAGMFEKNQNMMLKFLNFYRITQYYVVVYGPFVNQVVLF